MTRLIALYQALAQRYDSEPLFEGAFTEETTLSFRVPNIPEGYTPELLDAHQLRTLEALAESLVPGSTAARVAAYLDQLIAVDSPTNQRDFVSALGAFDMAAMKKHSKAWIAISSAEQDALLREASTADSKSSPMRAHFENLKTWVAGAYYSSEAGMRELGWDGNTFHQELPGCTHPGGHLA